MTTEPDLTPETWARVRTGDPDAFVELYERTARAVFGFCLRRTGNWELAEDATSLVFLEAWRLRGTLRSEAAGLAWLFGISHNVVRNSARARRRHQTLLRRLPLDDHQHGFETEAAERLDAEQHAGKVVAALTHLSRKDQEILTMAASAPLTTEQLAEALGIPVGTAKSRLSRARRRLAELADASDTDLQSTSVPRGATR